MPNFKEKLLLLIEKTDRSRKKTANLLGISEGYLSQITSGDRNPSAGLARKIDAAFAGKPIVEAESRTSADSLQKIPVVSWTTAGKAMSFEDLAPQIDEMVDSSTKDPNAFAIEVVGDSMEGLVLGGDRVVCEPNREATNGDMAYVRFTDEAGGGGTLKWFYRTGPRAENIKLVAENEAHEPREEEVPGKMILFAYPVINIVRRVQKRRSKP